MISLVICARTPIINSVLAENIAQTIGTLYELIVIDNSNLQYSIFEAYNLGVSKCKGDIICFMHDDIFYHTKNWGNNVNSYFQDQNIGAIGIAGSPYVTKMPGTWWGGGLVNQQLVEIKGGENKLLTKTVNGQSTNKNEVVVLDGVWICVRKSLFDKIQFDDANFKGFHFYDIDICLQINKLGYKIYTVFDLLMEHHSKGNVNQNWIENVLILNQKWHKKLPVSCIKLSKKESYITELNTLKEFANILIANGSSPKKSYLFVLKHILKRILFLAEFFPKFLAYFLIKYFTSFQK